MLPGCGTTCCRRLVILRKVLLLLLRCRRVLAMATAKRVMRGGLSTRARDDRAEPRVVQHLVGRRAVFGILREQASHEVLPLGGDVPDAARLRGAVPDRGRWGGGTDGRTGGEEVKSTYWSVLSVCIGLDYGSAIARSVFSG